MTSEATEAKRMEALALSIGFKVGDQVAFTLPGSEKAEIGKISGIYLNAKGSDVPLYVLAQSFE